MQKHKLEKTGEGKLYCSGCQQTWKGKPRKLCPGVPIIDKKHPDYNNLGWKYWRIDSLQRENLRPITKACCVKEDKEYIYYYDKEGETEKIDPSLPPVLDRSCCDFHYESRDSHCLKSELGLLKLNLVPGNAKPVAVYDSGKYAFRPDFKPLYNPLDCAIVDPNMPSPSRRNFDSWEKINRKSSDLLDNKKLKEFNLKPRANMIACWAEWNSRQDNWEFLWDIKQCEIDDTSLPPVYQEIPKHLIREDNLFKINKKVTQNTKPKGCIWVVYYFVFLYDPEECELIDPDLPPIVKWSAGYSQVIVSKYCPSYLKDELGLKKLNLTPGNTQPVAVYYNGVIFIPLYNPLDCQVLIPNLPPIKQNLKNIPDDLMGDRELPQWNLKPRENMKGLYVFWNQTFKGGWEYFWDIKQCEIDNLNLPPVVAEKPDHLYEQKDLAMLNRWVGKNTIPTACFCHWGTEKFILLYNPEDCELSNPNLPPCYDINFIPKDLKSEWGWQQAEPLFKLKKDAIASGCFLKKIDQFLINNNGVVVKKPILLYDRTQLEIHDREVFLSQTKLKQNYHLSPTLLKQLGKPDKYETNPINEYYAPVKLYSRYRVEKFLDDNADAYSLHLSKRDKYLAIFEKNKDKLLSPKSRQKARETKRLKKKVHKVVNQFNWDDNKKIVITQSIQCLKCASGIATNFGFLCAINPCGLDLEQMPCKDWKEKSKINEIFD